MSPLIDRLQRGRHQWSRLEHDLEPRTHILSPVYGAQSAPTGLKVWIWGLQK